MNKRQLEVQKASAQDEAKILRELRQVYTQASKDCAARIQQLSMRTDLENLQSIVYQKKYQEMILDQIEDVLYNLEHENFTTVSDFLKNCYSNGYVGTMYDMQGQGVPLVFPINQEEVAQAIRTDSKISGGLYKRMGEDTQRLKTSIRAELSRGIAAGQSWNAVAAKIAVGMNSPFDKAMNRTMGIARTEGHRVQQEATLHCQQRAKSKGADVVKQWDSTLDGKTRPEHRELDGQIREVEKPFEVAGMKAMFPSGFGDPSQDCNCRCCLLQRARWALKDEDFFTKWNGEKNELVKIDAKSYDEFKEEVKQTLQNQSSVITEIDKLKKSGMTAQDYEAYLKVLNDCDNMNVRRLYQQCAEDVKSIKLTQNDGYYKPSTNEIIFDYTNRTGRSKYSTLAHEYAHFFDDKGQFEGLHYTEIDKITDKVHFSTTFKRLPSSSDEFLTAIRQDKEMLKKIGFSKLEQELKGIDASAGVQDAIDGMFSGKSARISWGHGEKYYNRRYSSLASIGKVTHYSPEKELQEVYQELGFDAGSQAKTKTICRSYETASEAWANIMSAEINGGEELEYVKKYLPNSYEALLKILEGVK